MSCCSSSHLVFLSQKLHWGNITFFPQTVAMIVFWVIQFLLFSFISQIFLSCHLVLGAVTQVWFAGLFPKAHSLTKRP